jgi:hypothetical protein
MNIALRSETNRLTSRASGRMTSGHFEATPHPDFPETARELGEISGAPKLEVYEGSKSAMEAAIDTMARSFDALGQGVAALNRKIIEIAQQNVNSSFDLARSLATARTLAEVVELRAIYWREHLSALTTQAEELRELSAKVAGGMATPIKGARDTGGMDKFCK